MPGLSTPTPRQISKDHKYVTILDAGSSGTRIYVYCYATDGDGGTITPLELTLVYEYQVKPKPARPSLHQQHNVTELKAHLEPLLQSARQKLVSYGAHDVPIYLLATQGMRNLDRKTSRRIFKAVHKIMDAEKYDNTAGRDIFNLGNEPDNFNQPDRSARIIEGNVEGLLAWVAVNGFRKDRDDPTIGIYELGGASMQIAFDNGKKKGADMKDVCLTTGKHNVFTKSWPNYGVDTMWKNMLRAISKGAAAGEFPHPCMRSDQMIKIGNITYKGSHDDDKWEDCLNLTSLLITDDQPVPKAATEIFYGLGMPISGTLQGIDADRYKNGQIFPVQYDHDDFIAKSKTWCKSSWPNPNIPEDQPFHEMFPILMQRCASASWIVSLLSDETLYTGPKLRNHFYIPSQQELKSRFSWTMGAAALIARAQNSSRPGLKGCEHHWHGLEVMGIFNDRPDGIEDAFVAPAVQPAFDDESFDEIFTNNTRLIESSDVPSSAKFILSLSDNNFITAQLSLSFANFVFFAVILVTIGAWIYRGLRRAPSNIFPP